MVGGVSGDAVFVDLSRVAALAVLVGFSKGGSPCSGGSGGTC